LIQQKAVGFVTAAQILITIGDNPERLKSEASFAALCGVSPIPASSGKMQRHRLNRGGDRAANSALHIIAIGRL
jgi:transposase